MNMMQTNLIRLIAVLGLLALSAPAEALIIRDQCNQTSGDGQGHSCPPGDYLLIRPKYSDGTCGDWMCCPQMATGRTTAQRGRTQQTARLATGSRICWAPVPLCSIKAQDPARRIHQFFKSRKLRLYAGGSRTNCRNLRRRKENDVILCAEMGMHCVGISGTPGFIVCNDLVPKACSI